MTRVVLIKDLKRILPFVGNSDINQICKFIESDRKRIVEPLVKYNMDLKNYPSSAREESFSVRKAIDETIKNAMIEE